MSCSASFSAIDFANIEPRTAKPTTCAGLSEKRRSASAARGAVVTSRWYPRTRSCPRTEGILLRLARRVECAGRDCRHPGFAPSSARPTQFPDAFCRAGAHQVDGFEYRLPFVFLELR